jgi:multidrug resistance protein
MSPLLIVFVTVFIDLLGFGMIIPLLPFYAERFGGGGLTVGLLSVSFSLMQFIFVPILGRWSDQVGRRPIIMLGLFGSFASYLVFAFARSLTLLFVSRAVAGVAGGTIATAQAFIADTTTAENRAKGMGLIGAAFGLGFIFGPALGGFLSRWSYAAPPIFASLLSLANLGAAWLLLPESLKRSEAGERRLRPSRVEALRRALERPCLPVLLAVYFVIIVAFSGFEATFALFSEHRHHFTASMIGNMFAYVGVLAVVVQGGLVGRAARRLGERTLVALGAIAVAAGLAFIPLAASWVGLSVAAGLMAIGMGFGNPSLSALISRWSSAEDQGGILGLSQSLGSLARIVGPAWGGFLFDHYGPGSPYFSSAVLMLLAFAVSVAGLRMPACER